MSRTGLRSLGHAVIRADSYGLVLLLVAVTYVISVSVTGATGASIVHSPAGNAWLSLRTSRARRLAQS
jgi:hypothetical protein